MSSENTMSAKIGWPTFIRDHVAPFIEEAPHKLAPERSSCLRKILESHNVSYEVTKDKLFNIRVTRNSVESAEAESTEVTSRYTIKYPIGSLMYMWVYSYYFYILLTEYKSAQLSNLSSLHSENNQRLQDAIVLLDWATKNLDLDESEYLPTPYCVNTITEEDDEVTSELFYGAIAWVTLHEIGHIKLSHTFTDTALSLSEELEADEFATDWVFSSIQDADDSIKMKRSLSILVAVLCIKSIQSIKEQLLVGIYPNSEDRIYNNAFKHCHENSESLAAFAFLMVLGSDLSIEIDLSDENSTFMNMCHDTLTQSLRNRSQS